LLKKYQYKNVRIAMNIFSLNITYGHKKFVSDGYFYAKEISR